MTRHPLILDDDGSIAGLIHSLRRVAVLGIKTESQRYQPAFYVPAYLAGVGLEVLPVPLYFPDVTRILDRSVFRSLASIPPPTIDMVDVFRRLQALPAHLDDLLVARPYAVWFQQGIRNDVVALQLAETGIRVVQDRCLMVEHRRWAPLRPSA